MRWILPIVIKLETKLIKKSLKSLLIYLEKDISKVIYSGEQQIVTDKINFLLKFVFKKHLYQYESCEYDKPLFPDEITIYTTWNEDGENKENMNKEGLYIRVVSSQIFECYVYTISQYENILCDNKPLLIGEGIVENLYYRSKLSQLKRDTVFRNDEFVIVYCGWNNDNYNHLNEYDGYDSHIEDDWEQVEYTDDGY